MRWIHLAVIILFAPAMTAAVAGPEACHADQPFDVSLLHRGDEQPCRFGENRVGLKMTSGPGENAERLDNDIDSAQGALYGSRLKRVVSPFL
jgi:hypothetical protein